MGVTNFGRQCRSAPISIPSADSGPSEAYVHLEEVRQEWCEITFEGYWMS